MFTGLPGGPATHFLSKLKFISIYLIVIYQKNFYSPGGREAARLFPLQLKLLLFIEIPQIVIYLSVLSLGEIVSSTIQELEGGKLLGFFSSLQFMLFFFHK